MKKVNIVINPVLAMKKVICKENETSALSRAHTVQNIQTRYNPEYYDSTNTNYYTFYFKNCSYKGFKS